MVSVSFSIFDMGQGICIAYYYFFLLNNGIIIFKYVKRQRIRPVRLEISPGVPAVAHLLWSPCDIVVMGTSTTTLCALD